ncbi:AraC family transcriptional regulator [Bradyrhizobium iriomotense]|uniref:AraC family transcriptional regulator n=1 Tax=Bradyrhizobium iriomotense TaxID=441950 RepID=A0ABQ6AN82_9BRAD|nr:AraC family transcriptional regulator [Bradyrhizobium iriomotense]GLR83707.1 AraC family transcriptional regulator [Bradyrhizobium iriomotense]
MPVRWLKPSRILTIERFTNFDQFRPTEVLGGGTSTPLEPRHFSAFRASLPLPDSLMVMQRSFARHLEADIGIDRGVGLLVPLAAHSVVNGREIDNSMIGLVRGKVPMRAIEQHANTYLMLRFNSDMRHRGWTDFNAGLEFYRLADEPRHRLRAAILDMFCLASSCNDPGQFEAINRPIQETLLGALDAAFVPDAALRARPGSFDRHRRLVEGLDEQTTLLGGAPLYSDDLATTLNVSVRTLQAAVQTVHGMSLHHYLRTKRLWTARKQLVSRSTGLTVKAVALANGFWHMGDFAKSYKSAFCESPSETLARARHL